MYNNAKGKDVIMEDLRETCLHRRLSKQGKEATWWDYMKIVHSECYGFVSEACSRNAHKELGLDFQETKNCVKDSFDGKSFDKADN